MPKKYGRQILKIVGVVFLTLTLFFMFLLIYFNSKNGQKWLGDVVIKELNTTFKTPVSGEISYSFPDWVKIENLLIKDAKRDTLLFAKVGKIDIDMFAILNNNIKVNQVFIDRSIVKIYDIDGKYNYEKILDALNSGDTTTTSKPFGIELKKIILNNTKIAFADSKLGHALNLKINTFETGFELIIPDKSIYKLKNIDIDGLSLNGKIGEGTLEKNKTVSEKSTTLFGFIGLNLKNFNSDLLLQSLQKNIKISQLNLSLDPQTIDLANEKFEFKSLKSSAQKINFQDLKPAKLTSNEINFSDLAISNFATEITAIKYAKDTISVNVKVLRLIEKSGLALKKCTSSIRLIKNDLVLNNALIKTNSSELSPEIAYNTDSKKFKVNIKSSKLAFREMLYFKADMAKNESYKKLINDNLLISGFIYGDVNSANIEKLLVIAPINSTLNLNGKISDFQNPKFNLNIANLKTSKSDMLRLLPKNVDLSAVEIPQKINLSGNIFGDLKRINAKLNLNSEQGVAHLNAKFENTKISKYDGNISLENYALGKLLKNEALGKTNAVMNFVGEGADAKTMKVKLDGVVKNVVYDGKLYQNAAISGTIANQNFSTIIDVNDPNAKLTWKGNIDFSKPDLQIIGKTQLKGIDLKGLGLSNENIKISGDFDINHLELDKQNPLIDIAGQEVLVIKDGITYPMGVVKIQTSSVRGIKNILVDTDFLSLNGSGNFDYNQLADVVVNEINKYFKIPNYTPNAVKSNYSFTLNGKMSYNPVVKIIQPGLQDFKDISFHTLLRSDGNVPILGKIEIPYLLYDSVKVYNTNFSFVGDGQKLEYSSKADKVIKDSYRLRNATLNGTVQNNLAGFNLAVKDSSDVTIHALSGSVENIENDIRLRFDESGSLLFYEDWAGNPYGYVDFKKDGIIFHNVVFTSGKQIVRVTNLEDVVNAPIRVFTQNIDMNRMAKAILQDSTLVSGTLNVDVQLNEYTTDAINYAGDFEINDFVLNKVALGKLDGNAKSDINNSIKIESKLLGPNSDLNVSGVYSPEFKESLDFFIKINKIDNKLIEAYSTDILKNIQGKFTADIKVKGELTNPQIVGEGYFDDFKFNLVQTGALMKLEKQQISFQNKSVQFKDFQISDLDNNLLNINGELKIEDLPNYTYNLKIKAKNYKLIDAKKGENQEFIGSGYFDSDLKLTGKNLDFLLTGDVKINDKTDLTMLMPDETNNSPELQSIVEFISFNKSQVMQRKAVAKKSSINFANSVNINAEIENGATLKILMDPVTGDLMTVNGNGKLTVGFDNKGDLYIVGKYNIEGGKYNLTYQVIKKQFKITPNSNSSITWSGDPMEANLDITAEYNAGKKVLSTFPFINITASDSAELKKNVTTRIDLVVGGVLSKPTINFDLVLLKSEIGSLSKVLTEQGFKIIDDDGKKDVDSAEKQYVENIKSQAIFLLVSGQFGTISNIDLSGGSMSGGVEKLAREKISDLITSQLSRYTKDIIKGLDLDLGVQSGLNSATASRNTNVNVGISKRFANDRLILKVGKNFELENKELASDEIFDNLQANWLITKDGKYRINIFRKTKNQGVLEGTVIETGLGFALALDYDVFKDLKRKKKQ